MGMKTFYPVYYNNKAVVLTVQQLQFMFPQYTRMHNLAFKIVQVFCRWHPRPQMVLYTPIRDDPIPYRARPSKAVGCARGCFLDADSSLPNNYDKFTPVYKIFV